VSGGRGVESVTRGAGGGGVEDKIKIEMFMAA